MDRMINGASNNSENVQPDVLFLADRNDYLYRAISHLSKGGPLATAALYFLLSYAILYAVGYATGQLTGSPSLHIRPMYEYWLDNLTMGFLAPVGAGLLCHLYRSISNAFHHLDTQEIITKTELTKYQNLRRRAYRLYNSIPAALIAVCLSLAINTFTYIYKTDSFLTVDGGLTGLYGRIFVVFNYSIIFLVIYKYFVTVWVLQRLFTELNVRVRPIHPDRSGGLKAIGDLAIAASYFMALVVIYTTLLLLFDPFSTEKKFYLVLLVLCYPVAIYAFFASLAKAHRKMIDKKNEVLETLGRTFDHYYEHLGTPGGNRIYDIGKVQTISNIDVLYRIVISMPVWPFDAQSLRRFFTSFAIPILLFIVDALNLQSKLFSLLGLHP